jgi:outer membrane protein OmpA-like peptidoglycan-associated protein
MESVTDMASGFFGPDTLGRVSAWLHETPGGTKAALGDALPISLLGLANQASSDDGARALLRRFQRGEYPHLEAGELGQVVSDPAASERVVETNRGLAEGMFGPNLEPLVDGVAKHSGVSPGAVSKLLALAASLIVGMIGKRAVEQHLDAVGLRSLLGEQQRSAVKSLPGSLARLVVPAGAVAAILSRKTAAPAPDAERRRASAVSWWIIGVLVAIAVAAVAAAKWSRHRPAERVMGGASVSREGPAESLSAGHVSALVHSLDGKEPLPQRFVVRDLEFVHDSAEIEGGTRQVLNDIAVALSERPGARVRVEGHTDGVGSPEVDGALSAARAEAVKRHLVERGVDLGRIETAGFGARRPLTPNDTPEGRAENRRIELVVTAR